ncbi:MAG: ABC transporter permease [Deltaproteobacteria bacterium]|nr:ABC transporter permease [Deltaproteobacteria bacterium]MBW2139385.1 ABC transporter permease [Deltaproteobacteria bacterium]
MEFEEAAPRVKGLKRFSRTFFGRKVVAFGLVVILALVVTAVFAPFIAPYDPYKQDLDNTLSKPSSAHLLGTDTLGRDVLSRIIFGTRTSLLVGIVAIFMAASIGMLLGLVAGYFGGLVYTVIMRLIDALMTFPMILLALTIATVLGGGLRNIILALGVSLVPPYARLMCGQVLTVKQNDYVMAGQAMGASNIRIMFRHVAPNCFPPLIVLMTMMMGGAILAEAGLSFLGIGIKPPGAAWGAMVSEGYRYLLTNPVLSFAPGVAIMLVVFAFNMVGDGLRDALDPRLRGAL